MSKHELPPVLSADGQPVAPETLAELGKPETIPFFYRGLMFTLLFDRAKVKTEDMLNLSAKQAQLRRQRIQNGDTILAQGEEIQSLTDSVEGLDDKTARETLGEENWARIMEFSQHTALVSAEEQPHLFPLRLRMIAPGIIDWNLAGRGFDAESLEADAELARAVVPEVWAAYRPTTTDSPAKGTEDKKTASSSESVTTTKAAGKKANSPKGS